MKEKSLKNWAIFIVLLFISSFVRLKAEVNPEEIIKKSIDAQGGREALEKVKDTVSTASVKIYTPQGEYLGERKTYTKSEPEKLRFEMTFLGMTTIIGFDGQKAWMEQMGKTMLAPQTMTDSFKASMKREDLLLKYKVRECQVEYLGPSEVENQSCHKIKFTDKEGNETIYHLDVKIYLPIKIEFDAPDESGKIAKNEILESDFRSVENLLMPFKVITYVNGKKLMETAINEIRINQNLEDSLFSIPEKK